MRVRRPKECRLSRHGRVISPLVRFVARKGSLSSGRRFISRRAFRCDDPCSFLQL